MNNVLQQEHALLRVPHEGSLKLFRGTQRGLERKLKETLSEVDNVTKGAMAKDNETCAGELDKILIQLKGLKRKLLDSRIAEEEQFAKTRRRLEHLQALHEEIERESPDLGTSTDAQAISSSSPSPSQESDCSKTKESVGTSEKDAQASKEKPSRKKKLQTSKTVEERADAGDSRKILKRRRADPLANARVAPWHRTRLNRMLVDFMLREGCFDSAALLAKSKGIEHLVDVELFKSSRKIIDALRAHDASEALKWCVDNRARLKKQNSTLEFSLRIQEFVEYLRRDQKKEGILYARNHFSQLTDNEEMMAKVQRAMALLAFRPNTTCQPYRQLYNEANWGKLIEMFQQENYALHSLPSTSMISVNLQAGLSALKTIYCYDAETQSPDCPVCQSPMGDLARHLPNSHHLRSHIVCSISGREMNDQNPPMALPNGHVYSLEALEEMAEQEDGLVTCPHTQEAFMIEECKKVFVS